MKTKHLTIILIALLMPVIVLTPLTIEFHDDPLVEEVINPSIMLQPNNVTLLHETSVEIKQNATGMNSTLPVENKSVENVVQRSRSRSRSESRSGNGNEEVVALTKTLEQQTLYDEIKQIEWDSKVWNANMNKNLEHWEREKKLHIELENSCTAFTNAYNNHQSLYDANITKFNELITKANDSLNNAIEKNRTNSTYLKDVQQLYFNCTNDIIEKFNETHNERVGCGMIRSYRYGDIRTDGSGNDFDMKCNPPSDHTRGYCSKYTSINNSINYRLLRLGIEILLEETNVTNHNNTKNRFIDAWTNPYDDRNYCEARDLKKIKRIDFILEIEKQHEDLCMQENAFHGKIQEYNQKYDPDLNLTRTDWPVILNEIINQNGQPNDKSKWTFGFNPNAHSDTCQSLGYW